MTAAGRALGDRERDRELASYVATYVLPRSAVQRCAGSIMDMKVQGSRSNKALGIGELFASALLDRS